MENVRRPEKGYGLEAIVSSEECFSISVYDVNERQEKDEWVGWLQEEGWLGPRFETWKKGDQPPHIDLARKLLHWL